jgi:uncharacterized membrane protein
VELSRLRHGELIAGAGGVVLLFVMFLDWYGLEGIGLIGVNAWQAFSVTDLILALTALCGIGAAVLTAARRSPALPVAASVITTTLGLLAVLLVLYRILNQPGPNEFVEVKLGAFLGFLSVLAVAVGGSLSMRDEEGEAPPVPTEVRPTPAAEGPADPAPPPEA